MKKRYSLLYLTVLAGVLNIVCTPAQAQTSSLPPFTQVVGTQLANTNGQWVTVNPAQPNNIDLIETRIFQMPQRGTGVVGIEFQLFGGDGGTAWYKNLIDDRFANGGKGGELHYGLNFADNTTNYGRPFLVTFGKKGESVQYGQYRYLAAGGGGATGMSWLAANRPSDHLNRIDQLLIAAAGGGSGGFATINRFVHGASAWFLGTNTNQFIIPNDFADNEIKFLGDINSPSNVTILSGSSRMRPLSDLPLNESICCTWEDKVRNASGFAYNVFTYTRNYHNSNQLTSITHGQEGGKPTVISSEYENTPTINGMGTVYTVTIPQLVFVTKNGGRGGAGISGGGAGVSTTNRYQDWFFYDSEYDLPTSGAGGTGSIGDIARARNTLLPGQPGYNVFADYLSSTAIIPHNSTNNPQSGYFKYRTIADTEPPQINIDSITVYLKNATGSPLTPWANFQPNLPFMEAIQPYFMKPGGLWDNDSIVSITASETEFSCFMAGQTIPVYLTLTDAVGLSTNGILMVTVVDPYVPIRREDPGTVVNVTNGPVTLTADHFPVPFDGCKDANGVSIHFPDTTFTCAHAGLRPIKYWYVDSDGNSSDTFTKTFNVIYDAPNIIYVDASATGGANNGLSWEDAFTNLQNALKLSCPGPGGLKIYVAQGTYRPDAGTGITLNDRNASFTLSRDMKLYGGFPAGGSSFENRNPQSNVTILSGAIGSAAATDNSYHVVTIAGRNAHIEGFTIQDGYANDDADTGGGGLFLKEINISPSSYHSTTIRHCKFLDNYGNNGGAVYMDPQGQYYSGSLYIQNCLFKGNTAQNGGAVYLTIHTVSGTINDKQHLVNCVFSNNTATANGGALFINYAHNIDITNCTFAYNNATAGGGTVYNLGMAKLHNSILYFNATNPVTTSGLYFHSDYNNIEGSGGSGSWSLSGVQDLGNNIDADPMFHTASALNLLPASPCRNAGKNSYNSELYDIYGGNYRIRQDVIDIGAFETDFIVYVAADAAPGGDGTSWESAFNNLNDGITAAGTGALQKDVWVKAGTYRPDRVGWPLNAPPSPGNRENTFRLHYTLKIYGGFAGTENSIAQRNIGANPTILSGDIGVPNDASDNVYHVVYMQSVNSHLDGFIIEGGNANGTDENSRGGGVYNDPMYGTNANKLVANCVFRNNHAADKGGAWYTRAIMLGGTDFVQSVFYNNTAGRGAAVYIGEHSHFAGPMEFNYYNITATNNTSSESGAGAFEAAQFPSYPVKHTFYNALLAGNMPENYNDITNPGNITLHHTYTAASATNIFANPSNPAGADGKIMTADDGLQLSRYSLAISYGEDTLLYNGIDKDITGNPRIISTIDAGAYESPYDVPLIADNQGIIYVRTTAFGDGTGSSWENATADLHNAIHATSVQKVFVATGRYNVGDHSFIMKNGVEIYGGFDPDHGIRDLSHERIVPNPKNNSPENSELYGQFVRPVVWNVFTASTAMNNTAVLDGFMITGGKHTTGGGVRNIYASPTFRNVVINSNRALNAGAGMYNENSSPVLTNVIISGNGINTILDPVGGVPVYGGGMFNTANSNPVLTNVTIAENFIRTESAATMIGPGIYNQNSSPVIRNSIFFNNAKSFNITMPGVDIENSGNVNLTLKNSMTQGYDTGNPADSNIVSGNPLFAGAGNKDYRLTKASPAINAGDNSLFTGLNASTKDLAGNPRVFDFANNRRIDMGAYEYQCLPVDYSTVTLGDTTLVYDGNPHSITVQGLPQGVAATYEIMNADSLTTTGNAATNAGIYTITATINPIVSGIDCTPVIKTAVLTINRATAIITTDSIQMHVYDGAVKNVTAALNHTEGTLGYTALQGYTDAGVYWISVSAPETDNYLPASEVVGLVIEKADFTGIALNDSTYTYDGTPKSTTITGTVPTGAAVVYGGNEKTDIGIYPVAAFLQLANYNDLWLTATMTITNPLPVTLVSFNVRKQEKTALLEWVTVAEYQNAGFEVEYSRDGKNWVKTGFVRSRHENGISTVQSVYHFTDETPANGINYYRLKQLDDDGRYAYSPIRAVTFDFGPDIIAYPNPVRESVTIELSAEHIGSRVRLVSTTGVVLQQITVRERVFTVSLGGYPAGVYLLHTTDGKVVKVVKE